MLFIKGIVQHIGKYVYSSFMLRVIGEARYHTRLCTKHDATARKQLAKLSITSENGANS